MATQDSPLVVRYVRQDDGTWVLTVFNDLCKLAVFLRVAAPRS